MPNSNQLPPSGHILETCQPCINLKIRCIKTQDSGLCDRCLRLGKTCVFNPARRRPKASRKRLEDRREASPAPGRGSGSDETSATNPERLGDIFNHKASLDPFERKILSAETGQALIEKFEKNMTPYFPFVLFPKHLSVVELNTTRPCACLAALAVASHAETQLQKALFSLFNNLVASRMVGGQFNSIDMLQGLLINLAWAHYQRRPKKYTQILHLATSIVSDLRLDRPRRSQLWAVDGGKDRNEPDWGPDEMRALIGAYYLSSISSTVLQKLHHFPYTPFISTCCEHLAQQNQHPTDKYLVFIIELLTLSEKVEEAVRKNCPTNDATQLSSEIQKIAQRCSEIKSTLPFPLNESPPLLLQMNMLELLLSQSSPQGTPFGLDRFENNQVASSDQASYIGWLYSSMSAVQSLLGILLALPSGEEVAMSNIGWVMMYCGLSLAVKLDLLHARKSTPGSNNQVHRFMDVPYILRQTILRLESTIGTNTGNAGDDSHAFHGLVERVRRLQEWRSTQANRQATATRTADSSQVTGEAMLTLPTETIPFAASWPYQNFWIGDSNGHQSTDIDIGNFLFTDPIGSQGSFYDAWFIDGSSWLAKDVQPF